MRNSEYLGGPQTATDAVLAACFSQNYVPLVLTVGVCSRFERAQAITDHKSGCAESTKRPVDKAWPGKKRTGAEQAEAPNEDGLVTPVPEQPVRVAK